MSVLSGRAPSPTGRFLDGWQELTVYARWSGLVGMTSMNVSLPEELKQFAEAQTKHGYSTPSEYVRELIREDRKRKAREKLDALLLEGLAGDPIPVDAKFWADLKQEALAKLESRKKASPKK